MRQEALNKIQELQDAFVGVFNQDEKALLENIRKHANAEQVSVIDDLLTNDFDCENCGYAYSMIDEWLGDIELAARKELDGYV